MMQPQLLRARFVFQQSDAAVTKAFYSHLQEHRGIAGVIAVNLLRACKTSTRAKAYRGRGYKNASYDVKQWSLNNLSKILTERSVELGFSWGWKEDPKTILNSESAWVIYIEHALLDGQVSFHSPTRGIGPDFAGDWDGQHVSESRILEFVDRVMEGAELVAKESANV